MRPAKRPDESGYILFGIVILLVILGVSLVAAVPLWQKAIQREREQELIFRGYQYMQAIERYQRKFPGAYPPTIDVLVEQKFLRKAYKDPFGGEKGEWNILRQLSPELQLGQQAQQEQLGEAAGITDVNRSRAQLRKPGDSATGGAPGSTRAPRGGNFQSSLGRGMSDASMGGIVGVASRSAEKTFYRVPGKEKYKDWLFVWGVQQVQAPVMMTPGQNQQPPSPFPGLPPPPRLTSIGFGSTPMGPAQPGQPGMPGQPGLGFPGQQPSGFPSGPGQPGMQPGMEPGMQPGMPFPGQQGQPGFGEPGMQGFEQPGFGTPPGSQPQTQRRRSPG
jgi:type II secretory pathway pseudopilin PulG